MTRPMFLALPVTIAAVPASRPSAFTRMSVSSGDVAYHRPRVLDCAAEPSDARRALPGIPRHGRAPRVLLFLVAAFVAVAVLRWPLVPVLLGLAPVSVLAAWVGTLAAWRTRT